jgi:hypothetical protein
MRLQYAAAKPPNPPGPMPSGWSSRMTPQIRQIIWRSPFPSPAIRAASLRRSPGWTRASPTAAPHSGRSTRRARGPPSATSASAPAARLAHPLRSALNTVAVAATLAVTASSTRRRGGRPPPAASAAARVSGARRLWPKRAYPEKKPVAAKWPGHPGTGGSRSGRTPRTKSGSMPAAPWTIPIALATRAARHQARSTRTARSRTASGPSPGSGSESAESTTTGTRNALKRVAASSGGAGAPVARAIPSATSVAVTAIATGRSSGERRCPPSPAARAAQTARREMARATSGAIIEIGSDAPATSTPPCATRTATVAVPRAAGTSAMSPAVRTAENLRIAAARATPPRGARSRGPPPVLRERGGHLPPRTTSCYSIRASRPRR